MTNGETSNSSHRTKTNLKRRRPVRPSGSVWVKAYRKNIPSKGSVVVNGHWRRSKPAKPQNPLYAVLQLMRDLGQNQADHEILLAQFLEAKAAFAEWKPGPGRRRKQTVNSRADAANTAPDAARIGKRLQVEILKQTVRGIDDSMLAAAGLKRITPAARNEHAQATEEEG